MSRIESPHAEERVPVLFAREYIWGGRRWRPVGETAGSTVPRAHRALTFLPADVTSINHISLSRWRIDFIGSFVVYSRAEYTCGCLSRSQNAPDSARACAICDTLHRPKLHIFYFPAPVDGGVSPATSSLCEEFYIFFNILAGDLGFGLKNSIPCGGLLYQRCRGGFHNTVRRAREHENSVAALPWIYPGDGGFCKGAKILSHTTCRPIHYHQATRVRMFSELDPLPWICGERGGSQFCSRTLHVPSAAGCVDHTNIEANEALMRFPFDPGWNIV